MNEYYANVKITGHQEHGDDYDEYIYSLLSNGKGEKLIDVLITQIEDEVILNITAIGTNWDYVSKIITDEINDLDGKIQVINISQDID